MPGPEHEDAGAFDKLHRELTAELSPKNACERDLVTTLARLVWRKQKLAYVKREV
jgi:hypothetical protein